MGRVWDCPHVISNLPVILTSIFQRRQFKRPYGDGIELRLAQLVLDIRGGYRNGPLGYDAVIRYAKLKKKSAKVLHIHGTGETFPQKNRVIQKNVRGAAGPQIRLKNTALHRVSKPGISRRKPSPFQGKD